MYDFQFLVTQDANIINALSQTRALFKQEFGGTDVRLKDIQIVPMGLPPKIHGGAPGIAFMVIATVESENDVMSNTEKKKIGKIVNMGEA